MATRDPITVKLGNHYINDLPLGQPAALATARFNAWAKHDPDPLLIDVPLALVDDEAGLFRLTLAPADTAVLAASGRYEYHVVVTDGFGTISTPVKGDLFVEARYDG